MTTKVETETMTEFCNRLKIKVTECNAVRRIYWTDDKGENYYNGWDGHSGAGKKPQGDNVKRSQHWEFKVVVDFGDGGYVFDYSCNPIMHADKNTARIAAARKAISQWNKGLTISDLECIESVVGEPSSVNKMFQVSTEDMMNCLRMDCSCVYDVSFSDFCDSLGYSDDSIKAKDIYDECLETLWLLRDLLKRNFDDFMAAEEE